MNKVLMIGLLALCAVTAGLIAACGTTGGGSASSASASYYSGKGGKGMSVAVLAPEGKGLSAEQNYLPTLVQGVFVADFAKYSGIQVLDRQNLEKVLRETESGIYEEGADFVELGKITRTDHILSGSVTKTTSGYSFAVTVADTTTGQTKAAYSGACSVEELDNFSGIKKASLELLTQMGVELTGTAKAELSGADSVRQVQAQTALARGITAQKAGNTAGSLAYYYTANQYDSTLKEAAARVNQMSAAVRTGSLGENIRNDIAWRSEWLKLLEEAEAYLKNNPNDALVEFAYSTKLSQGKVNYDNRIVELIADAEWRVIEQPPTLKMIQDLDKGLKATKRAKAWGMGDGDYFAGALKDYFSRRYVAEAALYNDSGKKVDYSDKGYVKVRLIDGKLEEYFDKGHVEVRLADGKVRIWGQGSVKKEKLKLSFHIKADDITDNMTIKITNVREYLRGGDLIRNLIRSGDDRDDLISSGYLIRSGTDIIPVSVMK